MILGLANGDTAHMDAQNHVMLTSSDEDIALASLEGFAAAGQDAADRLGVIVTARDAVTDEVLARFEPVS
jgi:hypothetical protein